jgi:hypothetical protein
LVIGSGSGQADPARSCTLHDPRRGDVHVRLLIGLGSTGGLLIGRYARCHRRDIPHEDDPAYVAPRYLGVRVLRCGDCAKHSLVPRFGLVERCVTPPVPDPPCGPARMHSSIARYSAVSVASRHPPRTRAPPSIASRSPSALWVRADHDRRGFLTLHVASSGAGGHRYFEQSSRP